MSYPPAANGTANGSPAPAGFPAGFNMAGAIPSAPPPLPAGWTEHKAPNGTPYFYNSSTKQSTYTRPLPAGFAPPFPPPNMPMPVAAPAPAPAASSAPPKKKEKPKEKIPVPGTTWTKVITTENNVFYTEKASKQSSWTVPDEIKEEVAAMEAEERAEKIRKEEEERIRLEEEREAEKKERDRIRKEIEDERRARLEAEERRRAEERERESERKRKAVEAGDDDAEEEGSGRPSKMQKREPSPEPEEDAQDDLDEDDDDAGAIGPVDDDDEEAWQRAVAAEIAREDAIKNKAKKEEKAANKAALEDAKRQVFQAPVKVELSQEEGKALFKALLYERDISPFSPWEVSLPLFINDPRYILLTPERIRRDVYEEYCREAARAKRLGKNAPAAASTSATGSTSDSKRDTEKEFRGLLKSEVKSTRTNWDDFRRSWKKDRRFFEFGKDDRQRERAFRDYLKELGERKRADAKRAEQDFMDLLKEHDEIKADSDWIEVKKGMVSDPRYDAVGSSSLRAELFKKFAASLGENGNAKPDMPEEDPAAKRAREKREKAEASLRERQQQVQGDRQRLQRDLQRSKIGAGREEGEREFGSLLVQAVREHTASWPDIAPQLEKDPRWEQPSLSPADKHRMFIAHLDSLAHKRLDALHKLFASHAPSLDTPFEDVFPEVVNEFAVTRLNLSPEKLEKRYQDWQRVRFQRCKEDFESLLKESSFVDFWGRLKNKQTAQEGIIPGEEQDEDEDEEMGDEETGGGRANLDAMAKQVDLKDMHAILQHDKRYHMFDHMPEERDKWLREHLNSLDSALATVHKTGAT